jgi:hypothetical protein
MKNDLLRLTKDMIGRDWLCFKEEDIRKACRLNGCDAETIDDCVENMRDGQEDCTDCYVTLINDLDVAPEYKLVREAKGKC